LKTIKQKLQRLEERFETVTLQLERLEIKRENLIEKDKSTYNVDNSIFIKECKQYEIQEKIEELELCN